MTTIIEKRLAARRAQIVKENAKFAKMTAAQKRVQIAKDVLAQLAANKIVATSGEWLRLDLPENSVATDDQQLQDVLLQTPTCNCCGVGALFMCTVERANALTVGQVNGYARISNGFAAATAQVEAYLSEYFDVDQVEMIEKAFERGKGAYSDDCDDDYDLIESDAAKFGKRYKNHANRMKAIMQNIIENKGTFNPTKALAKLARARRSKAKAK